MREELVETSATSLAICGTGLTVETGVATDLDEVDVVKGVAVKEGAAAVEVVVAVVEVDEEEEQDVVDVALSALSEVVSVGTVVVGAGGEPLTPVLAIAVAVAFAASGGGMLSLAGSCGGGTIRGGIAEASEPLVEGTP